jgi:hypothetical protein
MTTFSNLHAKSLGDILDSAFRLYRTHFLRLVAITIIVGAPMLLIQGLLSQWLLPRFSLNLIWLTSFFANLAITIIVGNLLNAVLVVAIAQAYHEQVMSIGAAYRTAFQRYPQLVLASLIPLVVERIFNLISSLLQTPLTILAVSGGSFGMVDGNILLFVGAVLALPIGLVLLVVYSQLFLYVQTCLLETRGPIDALTRNWRLLQGGRWRGLVLVLLTRLLSYFFNSLPWLLFTFVFFRLSDARQIFPVASLVVMLLGLLVVAPLVNAIHTVFYYALRERAEGYDLERNLAEMIS